MNIAKKIICFLCAIFSTGIFVASLFAIITILRTGNFVSGKAIVIGIFAIIIFLFGSFAVYFYKNLFISNINRKENTATSVPTTESLPTPLDASISTTPSNGAESVIISSENLNTTPSCIENEESQNAQYIEAGNTIYRTDERSITDEEIPYLMPLGYETNLQAEEVSTNPKFHRTNQEQNLSFNFEMKYSYEVNKLTEKFESLYRDAYKTNDLNERIALLNEAISAFEKAKKFCYSKGKGGTIYFQDMWENMHNSQNQRFSYLDNIQTSLKDTKYIIDEILPTIIDAIIEKDGILQKDLYRIFPSTDKSLI